MKHIEPMRSKKRKRHRECNRLRRRTSDKQRFEMGRQATAGAGKHQHRA